MFLLFRTTRGRTKNRERRAAAMPRPELVTVPTAQVREPVVSWGSTSTVSKWKVGSAQPWPLPPDAEEPGLRPGQFEEYMDVLVRTMRDTHSPVERETLKNTAVSGALGRLSHPQRILRDVLERVDQQMTALEQLMHEDEQNIAVRRAQLHMRLERDRATYEQQRSEREQQHLLRMQHTESELRALVQVEQAAGALVQADIEELQRQHEQLELMVARKTEFETRTAEELRVELKETQRMIAQAANERDEQRELYAILREEQAREIADVDTKYADIREQWSAFETKREEHETIMREGGERVATLSRQQQQLRELVDSGGKYLEELQGANEDLEAEFVRVMRRGPAGDEWYPVVIEVYVVYLKDTKNSVHSIHAKLITDLAIMLQVDRYKLKVHKVLDAKDVLKRGMLIMGTRIQEVHPDTLVAGFHLLLDEGIYLGYQSPVAGARFLVWQMDLFNKAAKEKDDPSQILSRLLPHGINSQKYSIDCLYCKTTRALTFENSWQTRPARR